VYSLHAVTPAGPVDCIADLSSVGVTLGDFPTLTAAGGVVFLNDGSDQTFVWKPGSALGEPQPYSPGIFSEPPIVTIGDYEYLVAQQGASDGARMSHFDCNRAGGCVELNAGVVPTLPGYARALTRWGSGAALLTVYDEVPAGGEVAHGVELRLVDGTGAALGGDYSLRPFEIISAGAATRPRSIAWFDAVAVPRVAASPYHDLLVGLVMRNMDATMGVDLARVRGCIEP
jgi:hypothetical protein